VQYKKIKLYVKKEILKMDLSDKIFIDCPGINEG